MAGQRRVDGDEREDLAAAVGAAIAAVYEAAELALLAVLTDSVRRAIPLGAVTIAGLRRLRSRAAAIPAQAEQRARAIVERAGVPYDYRPVLPPLPEPGVPPIAPPAAPPVSEPPTAPITEQVIVPEPAPTAPAAATAAETVQGFTEPSIRELIEQVSARVYREIPDLYQQAVQQAIESTRGGMPGNSLSLSRIQAAQKALDKLAEHGVTGFTDRAGRNWDLLSYVEMATRTAVSNAWDNLQNAALIRGGHDLIWTITHSTEGSCPECLPWLGKVLSLTGATTGHVSITDHQGRTVRLEVHATLAEARAAGFRHPNCRCSWIPYVNGADLAEAAMFAEPAGKAAATYRASQEQRAYERRIRRLGREEQTGMTAQARARARRQRAAAQHAAAAHRQATGLRMTQTGIRRREHPYNAH